jgi:hypothetical protein
MTGAGTVQMDTTNRTIRDVFMLVAIGQYTQRAGQVDNESQITQVHTWHETCRVISSLRGAISNCSFTEGDTLER